MLLDIFIAVRLAITLLLLSLCDTQVATARSVGGTHSWKSSSDIGSCQHIFRPSNREVARQDQQDPLLLWLGRPSQALQVEGKHGKSVDVSVWLSRC